MKPVSSAIIRALLLLFGALPAACGGYGPSRATIERIVGRDAVFFDPGFPPQPWLEDLAASRVALLGETHYVQQHQEFLILLLARLHAAGFRFILQEDMQATAWAGEEFAMLRSDVLPKEVAAFDKTLLEGIRSFNETLADVDRIHFVGFDMNNWKGIFPTYLRLFQARFGRVPQLDPLLNAIPDSADYGAALSRLTSELVANQTSIVATIGSARYSQLLDLVDVEGRSLQLRWSFTDAGRELFIKERVQKAIGDAGGARITINTGMYHAQKEKYMGPTAEFVGTWLANHPETYGGDASKLRSIVFIGAKGERKSTFNDPNTWTVDIAQEGADNDLTRILGRETDAHYSWLPLTDPVLVDQLMEVNFGKDIRKTRPGRQFDSIILYPAVTVLSSLSLLE
jgi:hypothetical protein